MNKSFLRFVALLLVPCLVADPAVAAAFNPNHPVAISHPPAVYLEQAFNYRGLNVHPQTLIPRYTFRDKTEAGRLMWGEVPVPLFAAGRAHRGYAHLPDEVYDAVIQRRLTMEYGRHHYTGKVQVAKGDPVAPTLVPDSIQFGDTPRNLGRGPDTPERLSAIARLTVPSEGRDLLIQGDIRIVFIKNLDRDVTEEAIARRHVLNLELSASVLSRKKRLSGAHYSVKRKQIYLDSRFLEAEPSPQLQAEFQREVHHELLSRDLVVNREWSDDQAHQWLVDMERPSVIYERWRKQLVNIRKGILNALQVGDRAPSSWSRAGQLLEDIKRFYPDSTRLRTKGHLVEEEVLFLSKELDRLPKPEQVPVPQVSEDVPKTSRDVSIAKDKLVRRRWSLVHDIQQAVSGLSVYGREQVRSLALRLNLSETNISSAATLHDIARAARELEAIRADFDAIKMMHTASRGGHPFRRGPDGSSRSYKDKSHTIAGGLGGLDADMSDLMMGAIHLL